MTIEEALDYCLANRDGRPVEELLGGFPEHREELAPLLALSVSIQSIEPPPVLAERRAAMKERLVGAASERRAPSTEHRVPRRNWWRGALTRRPAWAFAGVAVVALVLLLLWAESNALPSSPLYSVKLASENMRISLAATTADQIGQRLIAADSRLEELRELQRLDRLATAGVAIDNYRIHMETCAKLWAETAGQERLELATRLLVASTRGRVTFQELENDLNSVAVALHADVPQTLQAVSDLGVASHEALILGGEDPERIIAEAGIDLESVPTPLPTVSEATATSGQTQPEPTEPAEPTAAPGDTAAATATAEALPTAAVTNTGGADTPTASEPALTAVATPGGSEATPTQADATPTADRQPPRATPTNPDRGGAAPSQATSRPQGVGPDGSRPAGARSSHTPGSARANRPTDVPPTQARQPTNPPAPRTPTAQRTRPPANTHVPPTSRPTNTHVPTRRPANTHVPPSRTPVPAATPLLESAVDFCSLTVATVVTSCAEGNCVEWLARVANESSVAVRVGWTAEVQIKQRGDQFQTVYTRSGASDFSPGESSVGDTFCYEFPPETTDVRVTFTLDRDSSRCKPQSITERMEPCAGGSSRGPKEPQSGEDPPKKPDREPGPPEDRGPPEEPGPPREPGRPGS